MLHIFITVYTDYFEKLNKNYYYYFFNTLCSVKNAIVITDILIFALGSDCILFAGN